MFAIPNGGYRAKFQFTPLREGRRASALCCVGGDAFQFTPLREGRRDLLHLTGGNKIFQFTPLREGRLTLAIRSKIDLYISIHAPPRGATLTRDEVWNIWRISIHAPPRGATGAVSTKCPPKFDFNSRPSARGDAWMGEEALEDIISIHAPPRGATEIES